MAHELISTIALCAALGGCASSTRSIITEADAGSTGAALLDGGPKGSDAEDAGVMVAMTVTKVSVDGSMVFSVPVSIGGSPQLSVMLDTGSSGLRIIEGAVPSSAFASITDAAVTYSYHSGLEITGVLATASFTIGGLTTPGPIPVMLVEAQGCTTAIPNCGVVGSTPDPSIFGGNVAILGVGLRNFSDDEGIGSAIAQLSGPPAFAVEAPDYGGSSGALWIGSSSQQLPRFATYQLPALDGGAPLSNGVPAWDDRYGLPSCVDDVTSGTDYCLGTELDTGMPPTYIEWPADTNASVSILPSGADLQVTIGPSGTPLGSYSFTIGSSPTPGVDLVEVEPASGTGFMNLGTAVFFRYDVLFDPKLGLVGLAPH